MEYVKVTINHENEEERHVRECTEERTIGGELWKGRRNNRGGDNYPRGKLGHLGGVVDIAPCLYMGASMEVKLNCQSWRVNRVQPKGSSYLGILANITDSILAQVIACVILF